MDENKNIKKTINCNKIVKIAFKYLKHTRYEQNKRVISKNY